MNFFPTGPRRHFFRFSLRGLLAVVLVIAVALGWTLHEIRKQRIAVAALRDAGFEVGFADSLSPSVLERLRKLIGDKEPRNVIWAYGKGPQITDAEMSNLRDLDHLKVLKLIDTSVTDAGFACLDNLSNLSLLYLSRSNVSDVGLIHLRRHARLEYLDLSGTQTSDAGLAHVQELIQLKYLWLDGTRVTNDGLFRLRGLTDLEYLNLSGTQVSDSGLAGLKQLAKLATLEIQDTHATIDKAAELRTAIPNLTIYLSEGIRLPMPTSANGSSEYGY